MTTIIFSSVLLLGAQVLLSQGRPTPIAPKSKEKPVKESSSKSTTKQTDHNETNLQIGGGLMGSVLYLSRNIKEKNDAKGYAFHFNYGGSKLCRLSFQYTYYKPLDIGPTWYNIRGTSLESNLEVLARFPNGKSYLYPFAGVSYNTFTGYFTGFNDFLNLKEFYTPNTTVRSSWVGLNLGSGFEHAFGPIVFFMDYRMRVGVERGGGVNIMDVCYGAGLRLKVSVMRVGKLFRKAGAGDRYHWF